MAHPSLLETVSRRLHDGALQFIQGSSWTTDAPFRETSKLIAARRDEGIIAVEMEATALLAMAEALDRRVICLAQITSVNSKTDHFD